MKIYGVYSINRAYGMYGMFSAFTLKSYLSLLKKIPLDFPSFSQSSLFYPLNVLLYDFRATFQDTPD